MVFLNKFLSPYSLREIKEKVKTPNHPYSAKDHCTQANAKQGTAGYKLNTPNFFYF